MSIDNMIVVIDLFNDAHNFAFIYIYLGTIIDVGLFIYIFIMQDWFNQ